MKNKTPSNAWYVNLLKLLQLETTTPRGRVNLAGVIVLAVFCLIYTGRDVFMHLISTISDIVKSLGLKTDIYHPYQSISVIKAALPVLILFIICLLFLWFDDKKRNNLQAKTEDEVENPIDKI